MKSAKHSRRLQAMNKWGLVGFPGTLEFSMQFYKYIKNYMKPSSGTVNDLRTLYYTFLMQAKKNLAFWAMKHLSPDHLIDVNCI